MKMEEIYANISIDFDGENLEIAEECSSGCSYEIKSKEDLLEYIIGYVLDCIDTDCKYDFELKKREEN